MNNNITDYQTFTTIDMPREERRKLNVGDIWSNSVECLECGDKIRSRNKHDFRSCKCGSVSVDGGSDYLKRAFKSPESYKETSVMYKDAENDEI
jgi:hypothetical protein